ncbi:heparinase II/III family protein [Candidatus Thiodictyon syntrophicum]|uniref:heparinase II/III family protein n=1 Tax=Candidatus Thiodictyon syntrophicum TaxID=1166950 RepID=UPI001F40B1EE|nr:heparinase II/III family protein [Candidatus Thiodictyon syntrophicum]
MANAKALVFAGSFFYGDEADAWRTQGREILSAQLCEQVPPDGGHCERSPMYHAILLDLVALRGSLGRPGARPPATPSPDGPLLASAAHDGYRRLA